MPLKEKDSSLYGTVSAVGSLWRISKKDTE